MAVQRLESVMGERIGLVLGSGLGPLADKLRVEESICFADAGLLSSTVPGHAGCFLKGSLAGQELWVMRGRVHLYEGYSAWEVCRGIRWMREAGVESVILTNAAGTLNSAFGAGSWMMLCDQLNLTGSSPLEGAADFVDLSEIYDVAWREQLQGLASGRGMRLHEGVYAGLRGPQYETPAEVRMLRTLGADAVGMSTVLEAIQARALGMRVLGLSCLTNWASGMPGAKLDHDEVLATGKLAAEEMIGLLEALFGS